MSRFTNIAEKKLSTTLITRLSFISLLIFFSCNEEHNFYSYSVEDWDLYRIPILEPYQIVSATADKESWSFQPENKFNVNGILGEYHLPQVRKIGVCDSVIFLYSDYPNILYLNEPAWLVIDARINSGSDTLRTELVTDKNFHSFLSERKMNYSMFHKIEHISSKFLTNYTLPNDWNHVPR